MSRSIEKLQRRVVRLVSKEWPCGALAAAAVIALAIALPAILPGHYEAGFAMRCETDEPELAGQELLRRLDTPELRAAVAEDVKLGAAGLARALSIAAAEGRVLRVTSVSRDADVCAGVARSVRARLERSHVLSSVPLSPEQTDALGALRIARAKLAGSVEALASLAGTRPSEGERARLRAEVAKLKTDHDKTHTGTKTAEGEVARIRAKLKELTEKPAPEPDPALKKELDALGKRREEIAEETAAFREYATKDHPAFGALAAEARRVQGKLDEIYERMEADDPVLQAGAQLARAEKALAAARDAEKKADAALATESKALEKDEAAAREFAKLAAARDEVAAEVARLEEALPEGAEKTFTVALAAVNGGPVADYRPSPFAWGPVLWGLLAIAAAFAAMLARKYVAAEIRTRKDLAGALDLPVLGELPRLARAR